MHHTRRAVLRGIAGAGPGALAGCSGLFERQSVGVPPVLEERPNAVYYPTHIEGMEMIGTAEAGDRMVGLMYSYAHRFWTMDVGGVERVSPGDTDVHLMASVWDPDSERVLPVRSGLSVTITKGGVATAADRDGETYLAISPRTPYNRYILPQMPLSATLTRDGETVFEGALSAAIGPDRGYHYGAAVDSVEPGDELTVTVDSPPQVSRHEGYETAFRSMADISMTVAR